jgi:hypothetical protein
MMMLMMMTTMMMMTMMMMMTLSMMMLMMLMTMTMATREYHARMSVFLTLLSSLLSTGPTTALWLRRQCVWRPCLGILLRVDCQSCSL